MCWPPPRVRVKGGYRSSVAGIGRPQASEARVRTIRHPDAGQDRQGLAEQIRSSGLMRRTWQEFHSDLV